MTCLMVCSQNKIQTDSLRFGDGWSGRAVSSDMQGRQFQIADWLKCLSKPHLLFEDVERTLKSQGRNCVGVRNLTIGSVRLRAVLKLHYPQSGLRQFFPSFRHGR